MASPTRLFAILSLALTLLAQSTTSSAENSFPTIVDTENTGAISGSVDSTPGNGVKGAEGSDKGAYKLGTGGIVGIVVVISIAVIAIGKCGSLILPLS